MLTTQKMRYTLRILSVAVLLLTVAGCSAPAILQPPPLTETPVEHNPASSSLSSNPPLPSIADAVAAVYPSVVTITTEATAYTFFFGPRTQKGAGSGWIYRQDGLIVTNNHVVEGAEKVTVGLADGRIFRADQVYRDPVTDLAVVKVDATGLPSAKVGDLSQLRVGDWVIAVGNPLGQGLRAKEGIVSGLKVSLTVDQGETLYDLIETSAAINPGNSGGPLVNMAGEVIGITSAKIAAIGVEGMGYAISTRVAMPIIEQLISKGYVTRPWLGVQLFTVDEYTSAMNDLSVDKGVVIAEIVPGGPAEKAGLKVRDVIIRFEGKDVTTAEALMQAIHSCKIGQEVEITFVSGRDTRTTHARLTESPPP